MTAQAAKERYEALKADPASTKEQIHIAKCAMWTQESLEKPGAKVRVYLPGQEGAVLVQDLWRHEFEEA